MTEDLQTTRKRLKYRANHRGIREMDIILGSFADQRLDRFDAGALAVFERVLEQADTDFLAWVTGQQQPDVGGEEGEMIAQVIAFGRKGVASE